MVYEAELVGSLLTAHLLLKDSHSYEVELCIDSQAAIQALNLNHLTPSHHLVDEAQKLLRKVKHDHTATNLSVRWVPVSVRYKERYLKACAQRSLCRRYVTQSFEAQLLCNCDERSMT